MESKEVSHVLKCCKRLSFTHRGGAMSEVAERVTVGDIGFFGGRSAVRASHRYLAIDVKKP